MPIPALPLGERNRAARRAAGGPKNRRVVRGRPCLGNPICTKETYDGTPFLAQSLGKASVGTHYVRNAMRRVRQGRVK